MVSIYILCIQDVPSSTFSMRRAVTPWSLERARLFGGNIASIIRVEECAKQEITGAGRKTSRLLMLFFLLCLVFEPASGDLFLRNVGLTQSCMVLNSKESGLHHTSGFKVEVNRLCGLLIRVSDYRSRGLGFDSRPYQIFWEVGGGGSGMRFTQPREVAAMV
jgi:hypothetical protein